jgi:hypothetical protein
VGLVKENLTRVKNDGLVNAVTRTRVKRENIKKTNS